MANYNPVSGLKTAAVMIRQRQDDLSKSLILIPDPAPVPPDIRPQTSNLDNLKCFATARFLQNSGLLQHDAAYSKCLFINRN